MGTAYKQLIADWRDVLPMQSVCMVAPIATPSEHGDSWLEDIQEDARKLNADATSRTTNINATQS